MTEHPKVFISYSHDSLAHKQWVLELGVKLRHNGVDVVLDQWDLNPGGDMTRFMEVGFENSERVLVICTDNYVRRANNGKGGVGYERLIITAELVEDLGTSKFIPIIRQASGQEKVPKFLKHECISTLGMRVNSMKNSESCFMNSTKYPRYENRFRAKVRLPNQSRWL